VVVTFLSMLELAKEQLLEVLQEDVSAPPDPRLPRPRDGAAWPAPIYVRSLAASDAGAANDPDAFELPEPTSDEHGRPAGDDAGD
jgi:segregation and condensation protein A